MKTIAIDFDGVIHKYSKGWEDGEIYDKPMEGVLEALRILYLKGYGITVFTTREDLADVKSWIRKQYNREYPNSEMIELNVTNYKPKAIAYIDDRAIRFTNWKDMLNYF